MKYARTILALAVVYTAFGTAPASAQSFLAQGMGGFGTMSAGTGMGDGFGGGISGPTGPGSASGTAGNTGSAGLGTAGGGMVDPVELAARAQSNFGGSGSAQFMGNVSGTFPAFSLMIPGTEATAMTGIANRQPLLTQPAQSVSAVHTFSRVIPTNDPTMIFP
jgi:hypothetical protein